MNNMQHFLEVSEACSKFTTERYSTSFSSAIRLLHKDIRQPIFNIYGFVRFADEIVDTFHEYNKQELLTEFKIETYNAIKRGISLNPILQSFQTTVNQYKIDTHLIDAFFTSMEFDLSKSNYDSKGYNDYIYGSAEVVGLMCLFVFCEGNEEEYKKLKPSAQSLGAAFQKVNFLRDLKDDFELLNRSYFPNVDLGKLNAISKQLIIDEIEADFDYAYKNGVLKLPIEAKFGVYMAYRYYRRLLKKLEAVPSEKIMDTRIRISDPMKINLLARSYVKYKLNII